MTHFSPFRMNEEFVVQVRRFLRTRVFCKRAVLCCFFFLCIACPILLDFLSEKATADDINLKSKTGLVVLL